MYDILLFDLDGTITDSQRGITNCVKYALESFGIHEDNYDILKSFIGPPLKTAFMEKYNMDEAQADKAVAKYRERYSVKGMYENQVYHGAAEMLGRLKENGFRMAIATSKPIEFTKKILEHFDLLEYFETVVGPQINKGLGEKPEIVAETIHIIGEEYKHRMLMIGDREMDVFGAKQNGISSVGVTYGFAREGELQAAGADYIVNSINELEALLLSLM